MFRMWGKIVKHNRLLRDITIEDNSDLNRTRKVFHALDEICLAFNLEVPVWLDGNIAEFSSISRTRFTQDSFFEQIPFDYLEIQVIEEAV